MGLIVHNRGNNNTGRFGNKLFQAAATIGIAKNNDMGYAFPPCHYYQYLKGGIPQVVGIEALDFVEYTETSFNYEKVVIDDRELNYNLNGFFQSAKYWKHCDDFIKQEFSMKEYIVFNVFQKYGDVLNNNETASVHIRRGDYLALSHFHINLTMQYYYDAMNLLRKDGVKFLIISDDMDWCKRQDWFGYNVEFIEGNDEATDLCLMTQCNHNIIANSSFSWWGQYLNKHEDKKVVAPKKWFGDAVEHDTSDLYLPNWILK